MRLVQSATVEKTRGLVKSFKDSFGFIERADVVGDVRTTCVCVCVCTLH